ncbi:hypothetical protein ES676_03705 [Bizionia saleffrena]|uniref:DUF3379 domain-containing protein n=1 Tax=Bizionia saleffrena TaxID=291189 RepID=A0A8H2LGB1_9FLAO|nr:hypothetical protein [Bizionia saleffrena]TYB77410.1 hypothetical protein ES676_03705 [Bizionia saleffrena]
MVLNNIEQLLEKYDNGETTLQEEQQLKDYFSQETVAPHLEMYRPMFAYFSKSSKEQFTKQVPLKTKSVIHYKWLSVAAVGVLMFGFFFNSFLNETDDYTETEKALAYQQVKESLHFVSKQFNKGTEKVGYLEAINTAGIQVDYLKEFNHPLRRVFNN